MERVTGAHPGRERSLVARRPGTSATKRWLPRA